MRYKDLLDKKTYEPEELAKHHNVDLDVIMSELEKGIEVEKEHTSDEEVAREIALDHLLEFPDYYTRLHDMEQEAENDSKS